ncbi:MAG: hypothetical protein ACYCXF_04205 [Thermoleophilia bacterium]
MSKLPAKKSLIVIAKTALLALCAWLFIPTVDILPAGDGLKVALDSQLQIHTSPLVPHYQDRGLRG